MCQGPINGPNLLSSFVVRCKNPASSKPKYLDILPFATAGLDPPHCPILGLSNFVGLSNFRGCTGEFSRVKAKKRFWFHVLKKNRRQKTSRKTIRVAPKISDFHFRRWWPISTWDRYFTVLTSCPPGFSDVVTRGFARACDYMAKWGSRLRIHTKKQSL